MSKKSVTPVEKTRTVPAVGGALQKINTDFAVANVQKNMGEKTFKKRMARFANSKAVLLLAVLMTVSALLTVFRPYLLSVKILLVAERAVMALLLWVVYATGGKRGMGAFAWLSVIEIVAFALLMIFFAAFIGCGMFSMQLLFTSHDETVRLIKGAGMWAVLPALLALCVAYSVFLFKRHERLICCNLRDALRYGFAFDKGAYVFMRNCIIVAVAMPLLYIIRGSFGDMSGIKALSDGARGFYGYVLPVGKYYWLNLGGVLVHSAVFVLSGIVAVRYSSMAKRFKRQKEARLAEEEALRAGVEELKELEAEKQAERQAAEKAVEKAAAAEAPYVPVDDTEENSEAAEGAPAQIS